MGGTGHWRGAAEYTFTDGEEVERKTERGDGQDVLKNKAPGRISEGGERKEPKFISDRKHRNF